MTSSNNSHCFKFSRKKSINSKFYEELWEYSRGMNKCIFTSDIKFTILDIKLTSDGHPEMLLPRIFSPSSLWLEVLLNLIKLKMSLWLFHLFNIIKLPNFNSILNKGPIKSITMQDTDEHFLQCKISTIHVWTGWLCLRVSTYFSMENKTFDRKMEFSDNVRFRWAQI